MSGGSGRVCAVGEATETGVKGFGVEILLQIKEQHPRWTKETDVRLQGHPQGTG